MQVLRVAEPTPHRASWSTRLDPIRRDAAITVARDVAHRASDRQRLSRALAAAAHQTRFPQTLQWQAHALADGHAGIALMCSYLDRCFAGEGWDVTAHGFLTEAARGAEQAPSLPAGLFAGLSGLAFAAQALSRRGRRYQNVLATLDAAVQPGAVALGDRLGHGCEPAPVHDFDVVSGASGIGAYLLQRDSAAALPAILAGLVELTAAVDGQLRWSTPPELMGDVSLAHSQPWGHLNCGLAHGIPGPLALLSLAERCGVAVPGQVEAVRRLVDWLVEHRTDDCWGVNWTTTVPLPPPGQPNLDPAGLEPARSAWCYGSPGVARALWLAGDALGEGAVCELAVEAMLAVYRRPRAQRYLDSPTFCHGVAGLLQITLRFAHDTGLPALDTAAAELVDQLLDAYSPERLLGYAALEPGANPVDRAGLLDGAPGVAMVLLAAATDVEPDWDRMFLLS